MWASAKNRILLDYAAIAAKMVDDRPAKAGSKDRSRIANISAVAAVDSCFMDRIRRRERQSND